MEKNFRIFFVTPFTDDYKKLEEAVMSAYMRAMDLLPDVKVEMVTYKQVATATMSLDIFTQLQKANLVICNVSKYNANAMYELGLAHALDRPTVILVDNETALNFDIASLRYVTYDPNSLPGSLIAHLAKIFTLVFSDPDDWKINWSAKTREEIADKRKTIFVSYSHKDKPYLDRLKVHLRPLERMGTVLLWSDTAILSGEKWKQKIEDALNSAVIALLLVSADFMASDFIINEELQILLKSAEAKGTIIIPLIVKPCRFSREPTISQFKAANIPADPLCKLSEFEQEEIYESVAHRIELALGSE
jgi:hypothetical protein